MSYRKLDVEEIQMPKYLAVLDIKRRDAENIGLYDNDERRAGGAFKLAAQSAWMRGKVHLNFREKFMAIKVQNPDWRDAESREVEALDSLAQSRGYEIVSTRTAVVYRIPRKNAI